MHEYGDSVVVRQGQSGMETLSRIAHGHVTHHEGVSLIASLDLSDTSRYDASKCCNAIIRAVA